MLAVSADTGEVITAQVLEPIDEVVEEEGETVVEVREAPPGSEQKQEEILHQEEVVPMKEEEQEVEAKSIQQPTRSSRRPTVLPERLRD